MNQPEQLPLFDLVSDTPRQARFLAEMGTFKDSMRAPVHNWFRYPAGYSYKFVDVIFDEFQIKPNNRVYDPFSGTGTTLICAKQKNIHGYGVEAHSFVKWVADVKLFWEYDYNQLRRILQELIKSAEQWVHECTLQTNVEGVFPELVYKCYHPDDLKVLFLLRSFIVEVVDEAIRNLCKLALTDTLRSAAAAGTGWPYIAPKKNDGTKPAKGAFKLFTARVWQMYSDLVAVSNLRSSAQINNILGDSRQRQDIEDNHIDLALTSPPYLNNYDYADRTRLEVYFWGIAKNWKEITTGFRDQLIVAATTQVVRSQYEIDKILSEELHQSAPAVSHELQKRILQLSQLRLTKGGKKDYDLMVGLYFNDVFQVLKETYRVLRPGSIFCLVLGDSAPYGVHIPTDTLIGELGVSLGYSEYEYYEFRRRGDKWQNNPQRHNVKLREGVIILKK
jgi:DNA modification methylase